MNINRMIGRSHGLPIVFLLSFFLLLPINGCNKDGPEDGDDKDQDETETFEVSGGISVGGGDPEDVSQGFFQASWNSSSEQFYRLVVCTGTVKEVSVYNGWGGYYPDYRGTGNIIAITFYSPAPGKLEEGTYSLCNLDYNNKPVIKGHCYIEHTTLKDNDITNEASSSEDSHGSVTYKKTADGLLITLDKCSLSGGTVVSGEIKGNPVRVGRGQTYKDYLYAPGLFEHDFSSWDKKFGNVTINGFTYHWGENYDYKKEYDAPVWRVYEPNLISGYWGKNSAEDYIKSYQYTLSLYCFSPYETLYHDLHGFWGITLYSTRRDGPEEGLYTFADNDFQDAEEGNKTGPYHSLACDMGLHHLVQYSDFLSGYKDYSLKIKSGKCNVKLSRDGDDYIVELDVDGVGYRETDEGCITRNLVIKGLFKGYLKKLDATD